VKEELGEQRKKLGETSGKKKQSMEEGGKNFWS